METMIQIRLANEIRIRKEILPEEVLSIFEKRLSFRNPLFGRTERFGQPMATPPPEFLTAIRTDPETGEIVIAKGYLSEVIRICHAHRLEVQLYDDTPSACGSLPDPGYQGGLLFEGSGLSGDQAAAVRDMEKHRYGIIEGPPGSGKRLCLTKLAIRKRLPMLVIVHTVPDMYAWKEAIEEAGNGIDSHSIGLLGDGHRARGEAVTIAITKTLKQEFEQVGTTLGLLVLDRCDQATWSSIFKTRHYNCVAQWGVAVGPRQDGLTRLMEAYIGPRVVRLPGRRQGELPALRVVATEFTGDGVDDWTALTLALAMDEKRNHLIITDLLEASAGRLRCLVVSDRVSHLEEIQARIRQALGPEMGIISSHVTPRLRDDLIRRFNQGRLHILGLVFKSAPVIEAVERVDACFFASPVKQADSLMKIAMRMGKDSWIHEYKDMHPMLRASLRRRVKVYRRVGVR